MCASQVVGLRVLMNFSSPFTLASGGFLDVPPLILGFPGGSSGKEYTANGFNSKVKFDSYSDN